MTDTVRVHTVFSRDPIEVPSDEAAALERAGLIRSDPAPEPEPAPKVTVTPTFTGVPTVVDADEAAAMQRAGLLIPTVTVDGRPVPGVLEQNDVERGEAVNAETGEVTPPGEPLPEMPPASEPVPKPRTKKE